MYAACIVLHFVDTIINKLCFQLFALSILYCNQNIIFMQLNGIVLIMAFHNSLCY